MWYIKKMLLIMIYVINGYWKLEIFMNDIKLILSGLYIIFKLRFILLIFKIDLNIM